MKRILSLVAFFATLQATAQQVNPVPDYVFRNQMSVGRNAVTDTAAYFSIGPRYGATKGFMPPIVGDTATFSSGKRNGLLIFSVQKNKFLYWDSVRVQWSDMAGSSGAYIVAGDTAAMLLPYLRKADTTAMLGNYVRHAGYGLTKSGQGFLVDTLNISTRAWRQKGIDSVASLLSGGTIGGSGTTNYVPKFTAASTIGNSQIFDNGTNVSIGLTSGISGKLNVTAQVSDLLYLDNPITSGGAAYSAIRVAAYDGTSSTTGLILAQLSNSWAINSAGGIYPNSSVVSGLKSNGLSLIAGHASGNLRLYSGGETSSNERMRIFANGRIGVNTTTDAGYQFDINGTLRSVNGANFATTSGNVGIGTASPAYKLDVNGSIYGLQLYTGSLAEAGGFMRFNNASGNANSRSWRLANDVVAYGDFSIGQSTTQTGSTFDNTRFYISNTGNVGIGTASPVGDGTALNIYGSSFATIKLQNSTSGATATDGTDILVASSDLLIKNRESGSIIVYTANTERGRINSAGEWIIDASGTDAGDYKLQVVGNARIGTGKLDIASNTTFGLGIARSGTSEIAGQIYNSNGILYTGVESSAGGQIFTGSSAYAAVIGSGANYPLQFATNNITRATMTTSGNLLLGFATDSYFLKFQVNGSIFSNNQIITQGVNAQISADSSANISPLYISNQSLTGTSAQGMIYGNGTWNTTGNPSLIDLNLTNTASGATSNYMKITDGTNTFRVTKAAEVVTAAPTGGSIRKWKLGEAATVSPTSPNRTIRVEIDGTVYYLHAKTTND